MKHEFIAKEDINRRGGDVVVTAKKGETVILSDRAAEVAASFEELEYKGLVPETEPENEFSSQIAETSESLDDLLKLKRDDLVSKAAGMGIAVNSDTKKEIAEAIIKRRETLPLTDETPAEETIDGENLSEENSINEVNE